MNCLVGGSRLPLAGPGSGSYSRFPDSGWGHVFHLREILVSRPTGATFFFSVLQRDDRSRAFFFSEHEMSGPRTEKAEKLFWCHDAVRGPRP